MIKYTLSALVMTWALVGMGAEEATKTQEMLAKAAPRAMKLLIASFGTINSQAEVEGWLGDVLKNTENIKTFPALSAGDKIAAPELEKAVVYANWHTRRMEYIRTSDAVQQENARRMKILTNLKTSMLSDASQRYTAIARDYLMSEIYKESKGLVKVVDRGNMSIQQSEKALAGADADVIGDLNSCILSVVMGDREEDSKTIPIDNAGTMIKRTTYTQPYVGKVRDMNGNILMAFKGTAEYKSTKDNVVATKESDPARKLVEDACEEIAEKVTDYFTTKLKFKIKVPKGMDEDDVEVSVDGRSVDADEGVRVLAFDQVVKGSLEGCKSISKVITVEPDTESMSVKLNFKAAATEE